MAGRVVDLCLVGQLVVTDPVEMSSLLENSLHLAKELWLVVVAANANVRSSSARKNSSRVANVNKDHFVICRLESSYLE